LTGGRRPRYRRRRKWHSDSSQLDRGDGCGNHTSTVTYNYTILTCITNL
jgi:hypothetical protein